MLEDKIDFKRNKLKNGLNSSYELYIGDQNTIMDEIFNLRDNIDLKFNPKPQLKQKGISKLYLKSRMRRKSCQCTWCGGICEFELQTSDIPNNIVHDQEIKNTTKFARVVNTIKNSFRPLKKGIRQESSGVEVEKKRGNIYGLVSGVASKLYIYSLNIMFLRYSFH